jgi:peptidoglycan hydrolase-like protein with peptidoglycan-binding domain
VRKYNKSILKVILLGGIIGAVATPALSQEVPGERRQPDRNLTRPGDNENIPGMRGQGTPELSKNDMRMVEEALKSKGYNPGQIDGVADDTNRSAIRSFQKDNGIPITGAVDQRTAEKLGVSIGSRSPTSDGPSRQGSPNSEGRSQGRDSEQNVPQDTRR